MSILPDDFSGDSLNITAFGKHAELKKGNNH
jgi:hypothetical protein